MSVVILIISLSCSYSCPKLCDFTSFSSSHFSPSAQISPCTPTPNLSPSISSLMFVQAVEEFLGEVRSREQPHSAGLVSQPTAVKFLMARKFDVSRAIELFQAYKVQQCFDW